MSTCAPQLGQRVESFKKPARAIDRIFIHCSATSNTAITATDVNRWHTQDNGWDCIGYHYFIRSDGYLEYGRTLERDPAAQSGHNAATIAVCLNGLQVSDFTEMQYDILNWLADQFDAQLDNITYHGHNEVAAKECPVFDYRKVLSLDKYGNRHL